MMDPEAAEQLTFLLAREVERDGGLAYVNRLVHYSPDIANLLKRCSRGSKLRAFLEQRPSIFAVSRCNPHTVALVQPGATAALQQRIDLHSSATAVPDSVLQDTAVALERRAIYGLRQRANKLVRRDSCAESQGKQPPAAPLLWLVGKCKEELHNFVRLQPSRPVGALIGTLEWKRQASPALVRLLSASDAFRVTGSLDDEESNPVEVSLFGDAGSDFNSGIVARSQSEEEADPVCERILELFVAHKRGQVGGINVGRLMKDHKLRALLAGRDLREYLRSASAAAGRLELFADAQRDGAWYVQVSSPGDAVGVPGYVLPDSQYSSL